MMNLKTKFLLTFAILFASVAGATTPECKTSYPVQVCTTIQSDSVVLAVRALEEQNEQLPIVGFLILGRIQLADGTLFSFQVKVDRTSWLGDNVVTVGVPAGVSPAAIAHMAVVPSRSDEAIILY